MSDPRSDIVSTLLRGSRLFESSGSAVIDAGSRIFTARSYSAKAAVSRVGDSKRLVHLVGRGKVRISRSTEDGDEITISVVGAGGMFGEEALFDDGPTQTTHAVCMEASLILSAPSVELLAFLNLQPKLALRTAALINEKLLGASATIEDLAFASVSDRVMRMLRRLAVEHGILTDVGTHIDLRVTHSDIAMLVGSTRETVSVVMGKLSRRGAIVYGGRYITLPMFDA